MPALFPDIALAAFKKGAGIDFVRFYCKYDRSIPLPLSGRIKTKRTDEAAMVVTIHDPRPHDIETIEELLPDAIFDCIEVFFDATPKGKLAIDRRMELIDDFRSWLVSHLYPWQGPGLQAATRVSRRRRHHEPVFSHQVERRPERDETMYFGHSDRKYSDFTRPSFASMRLYKKTTDNRTKLEPAKWRCRVEVTLSRLGCEHFGLSNPASLFGFDFRKLGGYFRLVRPEVRSPTMRKLRKWNPRMASLLEKKQRQLALSTLIAVGSHAASELPLINVDGRHRHSAGNRAIQTSLDGLTNKYAERPRIRAHGAAWGSW